MGWGERGWVESVSHKANDYRGTAAAITSKGIICRFWKVCHNLELPLSDWSYLEDYLYNTAGTIPCSIQTLITDTENHVLISRAIIYLFYLGTP